MQPFEIVPGWRIGTVDRQFTLEYLQSPRKGSSKSSWRKIAYTGRITEALEVFVSRAIQESDKELPEAVREVERVMESVLARLRQHMTTHGIQL